MISLTLTSGTARQIYAVLCANLLSISYGTSIGWASTSLPFLESNETILSTGPLTKEGRSLRLSLERIKISILLQTLPGFNQFFLLEVF